MHANDDPIQMDPTLDGFNADIKAAQLINYAQGLANSQSNEQNVLVLVGDDFGAMNAAQTFKNIE